MIKIINIESQARVPVAEGHVRKILGPSNEGTRVQVPIEEVRKFSDDFARMLEWFDRVGYDVDIAARSAESGVRPTRFAEWAAAVDWQPAPVTR